MKPYVHPRKNDKMLAHVFVRECPMEMAITSSSQSTFGMQITEYVVRPEELKRQLASNPQGSRSKFLESFYSGAAGMSQGL